MHLKTMKHYPYNVYAILLWILFLCSSLITTQTPPETESFRAAELQKGSPEIGTLIFNQLNVESLKYATLETGDEAIEVIVGIGRYEAGLLCNFIRG